MSSFYPSQLGARPLRMAFAGSPQFHHVNNCSPGQIWVARASDLAAPTAAAASALLPSAVTMRRERADQPDVQALIGQLDALQRAQYPAVSSQWMDLDALLQPHLRFVVVRDARQCALACGAVALMEDFAELRCVFVVPARRGQGLGSRLVRALEQEAVRGGRPLLRLSTGVRQRPAQQLFERQGFERCGPFGPGRVGPFSLFMEKLLGR